MRINLTPHLGWLLASAGTLICSVGLAQELVDPTRPAFYKTSADATESKPGRMRVEAILNRGGQRIAIVDGKVVRAGDRFADTRIEAIAADGIRYSRAGVTQFARLQGAKMQVRRAPVSQEAAQ